MSRKKKAEPAAVYPRGGGSYVRRPDGTLERMEGTELEELDERRARLAREAAGQPEQPDEPETETETPPAGEGELSQEA